MPEYMADPESNRIFVFCDFDGTITASESLQAVFVRFLPGQWEPVKEKLAAGETTLREAVPALIESIPSEKWPEIADFVSQIPVRPGFPEFLDFLEGRGIPLVIVSGGIRKMVEIKLSGLLDRVHDVVAVDIDLQGPYLRVHSPYEGGDELVDKKSVMENYGAGIKIAIGDGLTDFNMARNADLVFARKSLAGYLEKNRIPYVEWNDFTDIRNAIRKWLDKD